jgi:hypothetical protein
MKTGITLITPTHANPISLKRTMDSVKDICNEIVVGELCMFDDDKKCIESYCNDYNLKVGHLHFNYLYRHGFSEVLNTLAAYASNDVVLYLNVGEVLDKSTGDILSNITDEYNAWYIDHATEKHRWWRCYNRNELKWSGRIHEELIGEYRPFHNPIFTFADTDKDMDDPFKAWVANDVKEMVYWRQLMHIVDHPEELGATNEGWLEFAKGQYESMAERMREKGERMTAFNTGNMLTYIGEVLSKSIYIGDPFKSTEFIEYQGSPRFLGKK